MIDFQLRAVDRDSYDELFVTENVEITFDDTVVQEEDYDNYQIVYQSDGVTMYYKNCDQGGLFEEAEFNFLVVNDSDVNVTVSGDNMSINDYAITDFFYADCASGKKTNESISVYGSDLEKNNIENIEKLEFTFKCYNSDTYHKIWESDTITLNIN